MLTRIEVDGFKTFKDFSIDVPPFMVILGRNASGKSNLFDAIKFLSLVASGSLVEAVHEMRGEQEELLHTGIDGIADKRMKFAIEVLLDRSVRDDFGDTVEVKHSRLRYEIELELRNVPSATSRADSARQRLYVSRERATLIRFASDHWLKSLNLPSAVRSRVASYSSRAKDVLLDTEPDSQGRLAFKIHQDGRAGREKYYPAIEAVGSVLSTLTTAEYAHLFALKREMQSWRLIHLDPEAVRTVSKYDDEDHLTSSGANLANALHRLEYQTSTDSQPRGVLPSIASSLSRIVPEVTDIEVDDDPTRRQRQVLIRNKDEAPFTSRVASDGTLRSLALLTALYDPDEGGLICFEEPENGIYPQRLVHLIEQLQSLVEHSLQTRLESGGGKLQQLLLSSHSPIILKALRTTRPDQTVFIDQVTRTTDDQRSRVSRARLVRTDSQGIISDAAVTAALSRAEVDTFEVWELLG